MADIQVGITDAAEAARIINEDRAKTNGDSGEDFFAKDLNCGGYHNILTEINQSLNLCRGFSRSDGNLYINRHGVTNPVLHMHFNTGDGNPSNYADITANSFTPFTGCHIIPNENQNFKIGELICIEAIPNKDVKQPDWRGRYVKKGQKGIFGVVFQDIEEPIMEDDGLDEDGNPKQKQSGVNKFYSIACLGDMKVLCNGENGNIEYGDELCASSIPGVAMKFTGSWEDRNQICGKAGRSHTFTSDEVVLIDTAKE